MIQLFDRFPITLATVSLGKEGSRIYYRKDTSKEDYLFAEADPFLSSDTIETTGAGDTFGGCILHYVLEKGIKELNEADLKEMLIHANAAASIITTRRGALRVMPEIYEIEALTGQVSLQ